MAFTYDSKAMAQEIAVLVAFAARWNMEVLAISREGGAVPFEMGAASEPLHATQG